jgi:ergothioneine biosynthesis protein EgtB
VAVTFAERYRAVREATAALAAPLAAEDQVVQSMPDASPTKWHLAHTTWFFEAMVLGRFDPFHRLVDERYSYLFNSYYESVGERQPRPRRGLITRPTLDEVLAYRRAVDDSMDRFLRSGPEPEPLSRTELGIHHEQQHQELILTDIHHALWCNPLRPAYVEAPDDPPRTGPGTMAWVPFDEGLVEVGHGGPGFAFDNEAPRHRVFLEAYALADRPVSCGEYAGFIADGGYGHPEHWLSDGWAAVRAEGWTAPAYWERRGDEWWEFTLVGMRPVDPAAPVSHVSHFEADAFARWAGARLPTEAEWEHAAEGAADAGHFVESRRFRPAPLAPAAGAVRQMLGDVWEWTASAYLPYPRFVPLAGELGEYNGKFMSGQMVLRGGSCLTPASHIRRTYRNFFPPAARWQMSGVRLARWA